MFLFYFSRVNCRLECIHRRISFIYIFLFLLTFCYSGYGSNGSVSKLLCQVCPQADIVISSNTTWSAGGMNLCPGQKITVLSGATLTLNAFELQIDFNFAGQKWDGIYLNAGASLIVSNHSMIHESTNGITGLAGFNSININLSAIFNNGRAIRAKSSSSAVLYPIYLFRANLSNSSSATEPLIYLEGVNMNGFFTSMINYGSSPNGISAFNNRVALQGSSIKGFTTGIFKNVGGGFTNSSLFLNTVDILNSVNSINCRDMNVSAKYCLFSGNVTQSGTATGSWISNNFLNGNVILNTPNLSHVFMDNIFTSGTLKFTGSQSLTDAGCNFWSHCNQSVSGTATSIKSDWGTSIIASGNIHSLGCTPAMKVTGGNKITNHHRDVNSNIFTYEGQFLGQSTTAYPTCPGKWRIIEKAIVDPTVEEFNFPEYDNTVNNESWLAFHQNYLDAVTALNGADPSTNPELRAQIENSLVGMGQCVSEAMALGAEGMTLANMNIWIARADPLLEERKQIMDFLFSNNFNGLISYLNSLSLTGNASSDRYLFRDGIIWMQSAVAAQKDLYNLSNSDLSDLTYFANTSFGDFTEVLRGWLNMHYNIIIDYPQPNNLIKQDNNSEFAKLSEQNQGYIYTDKDCIFVNSNLFLEGQIEIFGIDGRSYFQRKINLDDKDCIKTQLSSGIYKIRISGKNLDKPIIQTYFVR